MALSPLVAVLISCLGLFGLITYTAAVRTKEMGIRKTLGASVLQLTTLLAKEFVQMVLLAVLIGFANWLSRETSQAGVSRTG